MAAPGPSADTDTGLDALVDDAGFFRSLVEHGSDAIVTIDDDSTIRYANQGVHRVLGYRPDDLIGDSLTTIMPPRFHDAHFDAVDHYLETGDRRLDWNAIEMPGQHADGHEIQLSITFEEHVHNGVRAFSGIMRDVSRQKAYAATLESLQDITHTLMQARTPGAIGDHVVGAAVDIIGFPVASLYRCDDATGVLRPVAQSDAAAALFADPPALSAGSLAWHAFETNDSAVYHADADATTPVHDPDGPMIAEYAAPLGEHGVLLVGDTDDVAFDDHTSRLIELLAANTQAALERATREAERERQNEQLERFASIVSHDLRDPLQTARATVALAKAGDDDALTDLTAALDRMDALIADVLTLAKHGQTVGETEPVPVASVAADAWSTAGAPTASLSTAPDLPTLNANPERLRTLFENLFGNAVAHGGDDVTVTVGALTGADSGGFFVADDGDGFGDTDTAQLFDYGYTTDTDGTGFGLSIVRDIATAHGWTIDATTSDSGGARFTIHTQ